MAADSAVGGNSYVSVADADAYFADSLLGGEWIALSSKDAALVSATRYLQVLGVENLDGSAIVIGETIPDAIKQATYELGLFLVNNQSSFNAQDTTTRIKVAVIEIENEILENGSYSSLPPFVQALINPYLDNSAVGNTGAGFTLDLH